jgi:hypothetical protein
MSEAERFFGIPPVMLQPNDRIVLRRKVLALVNVGVATPRALTDALHAEDAREIKRELDTLVLRGVVQHNGLSGWASEYHRRAA